MKAPKTKENRGKNVSRYLLTFMLSAIFTLNIGAEINSDRETLSNCLDKEKQKLEKDLFIQFQYVYNENLEINEIEVIELEEVVEIGFDTSKFLPLDFNALNGKNDLDWNSIELIEIEEELEFNFDTMLYLPPGFDPYKGVKKFINENDAIN